MKLLIALCLSIAAMNIYSAEIRFDSIDCSNVGNPPLQSRIIVTGQIGNFFAVKVIGGYPSYADNLKQSCVDPYFKGANYNKNAQSVDGYALYSAPFLYVSVPGMASVQKVVYDTAHVFVFSLNNDNSFSLLRDEWLGNFQGTVKSGLTAYDQLKPQVIYQFVN